MILKIFLSLLGLSSSDNQLIDFLDQNNISIKQELGLPTGDYRAYIERPEKGYCLVFTDEAMFLNLGNQALGEGELYLTGIFLYAEAKDNYSQFPGPIPFDITFDLEREKILEILGKPSWERRGENENVIAQRWDELDNYRLHIIYSEITNRLLLINFYY